MIILSLLAIVPFALLVISSFTDNSTLIANGYSFLPEKWSTYAYEYIFKTGNSIIHAYGVSISLTAAGTAISLSITTLLAYALSKTDLPGRRIMLFMVVFTMLFNGGLVPTYIVYTNVLNVKNTFWALLVPGLLMNGFNVGEILDAAYIDGAGEFQTFASIAVPLSKPIIATIGLFNGIAYWNDWMNGYIYLTKRTDLYSVQNLLNRMMQNIQYLSQYSAHILDASVGLASIPSVSVRMAMASVVVLPILVIYPFVQGNFVKGITLGGVKG